MFSPFARGGDVTARAETLIRSARYAAENHTGETSVNNGTKAIEAVGGIALQLVLIAEKAGQTNNHSISSAQLAQRRTETGLAISRSLLEAGERALAPTLATLPALRIESPEPDDDGGSMGLGFGFDEDEESEELPAARALIVDSIALIQGFVDAGILRVDSDAFRFLTAFLSVAPDSVDAVWHSVESAFNSIEG